MSSSEINDKTSNYQKMLQIEDNIVMIKKQLASISDGLTGLNLLNVLTLQNSVNNLGTQLNKMSSFNQNVDNFNKIIHEFNKLLKPISELASEKLVFSKKEAILKEKQFLLDLAAIRAKEYGISQWRAYTILINENTNIYTFVSGLVGIIIGSVSVILMKSKI